MSVDSHKVMKSIHFALAESGFIRSASVGKNIYEKTISKSDVDFPIKICIIDPYFRKKPIVLLTDRPKDLPSLLPHVFFEKALCYLDDRGVEFDRYNPRYNVALMLAALDSLLGQFVSDQETLQFELRRELPAYWRRDYSDAVFMAANDSKFLFELFTRTDLNGVSIDEIILADSAHSAKAWQNKRRGNKVTKLSGPGFLFELPHDVSIPPVNWPPSSIAELDQWLNHARTCSVRHRVLNAVFTSLAEDRCCFVVFQLHQMLFGGLVSFTNPTAVNAIKRNFRLTKQGSRGKNKQFLPDAKRISTLISRVDKLEQGSTFMRFAINDARLTSIGTRNTTADKNLSGVTIAVIGCGTLGGYTASLLCQVGAGTGGGRIELYDCDYLTTENLSRHLLGVPYVGENKSEAIAHMLSDQSAGDLNITAHSYNFEVEDVRLLSQKFDLVVDTTGDIGFSTSLCHHLHRIESPVPVIYGWIDAGGLAARTLLDDYRPRGGCYGCLKQRSPDGVVAERFQLFKSGAVLPEWKPRPCGLGGYMPFSSQASVTTSGLVQNLCIDWANNSPSPRFRHISLDPRVCQTKNADIKSLPDCPCCRTE